jgi:hypothetical protein
MASTRGPKRAKNAFLYFCDEHRTEARVTITEAQPELGGRALATAVQRELGRDWTTFKHTSGCVVYHERAALDKVRYLREKMEGVTITVPAKRPRGRPPANGVWNEETGVYDMPPPTPRRPRSRPRGRPPANSVWNEETGVYDMPPPTPRRPRGRPPKDSYWCARTSCYVKVTAAGEVSQVARDAVAACLAQLA